MNKLGLSVGDLIEVKTERLAYGGEAIARHQGLAVFVPGAAPRETLRVRITERKKSFARGVIEEIIEPSAVRREPLCQYVGECGGCQFQHITYAEQLEAKVGFIRDALKRTGQIDWPDEIKIHSASEFHYRLRAKIKIAREPFKSRSRLRLPDNPGTRSTADEIQIGFNRANSHVVCDVERCEILLPELNEALQSIRQHVKSDASSISSDEIEFAVSDISNPDCHTQSTVRKVSISTSLSGFSSADIQRNVAGAIYQFSPSSFFQVNALLLDEFVREATGSENGDFALDLYAGVGLFTIQLARNFKRVIGVESDARSVDYAKLNISLNEVPNATVVANRVDRWLEHFISQRNLQTPDLVLLDPPRSGAAEAVELLAKIQPGQIHYVSCDPNTLARDLKKLLAHNYKLERLVAFDMFPQTYHVETLAFLKRI
jgi:23S rRNA (uracil1939-C5)-methyltransferase